MADQKLPALTELTDGNIADGDKIYAVDVSDTTDDATGSSKFALASSLFTYISDKIGAWLAALTGLSAPASTDGLLVDDSGVSKRSTIQQVVEAAIGAPQTCILQLNGNQSIGTSGTTVVGWGEEIYDPDGMHTGSTPDIEVSTAGIYSVAASLATDSGAEDFYVLLKQFNSGGTNIDGAFAWGVDSAANEGRAACVAGIFKASSGDYFRVEVFHSTGATRNLVDTAYSQFAATLLRTT